MAKDHKNKSLFAVLVRAHKITHSKRYFIVAQSPEAARARAVVEFEKAPPDPDATVLRVWPSKIGPESVLDKPEAENVTIEFDGPGTVLGEGGVPTRQKFTYPQASCLDWTGNPFGAPNPEVLR